MALIASSVLPGLTAPTDSSTPSLPPGRPSWTTPTTSRSSSPSSSTSQSSWRTKTVSQDFPNEERFMCLTACFWCPARLRLGAPPDLQRTSERRCSTEVGQIPRRFHLQAPQSSGEPQFTSATGQMHVLHKEISDYFQNYIKKYFKKHTLTGDF